MPDQSSVFNETTNTPVTTDTTTNPDLTTLTDQLKGITNEDGKQKYDSLPKALDGLANSQKYIPELQSKLSTVEAENLALKDKLARTEAVEDVVSRLTQNQKEPKTEPTAQVPGLDENAVMELMTRVNTENAITQHEDANESIVNDVMLDKFGDKAGEVMAAKAAELNTTVAALQKQSRENPKLVLAAFGQQSTPNGPTTGSVNIPTLAPNNDNELKLPEKSMLTGATTAEQVAFMKQIEQHVYKKHDITG